MLLKLVPPGTKVPFMKARFAAFIVSAIAVMTSIVLFFAVGLNFGIDFRGGTLIEIQTTDGPADLSEIRSVVGGLDLGDVQIQEFGSPQDVLIRVEEQPGGELAQQQVIVLIRDALGEDTVDYRRVEIVGPQVSSELARDGTIAVIIAIMAILIYIWFRFEWQYALGAVVALVHDVLLTIGLFSIVGYEFNLSSIAAVLTIVGYSLNDTVVIYDRVRENLRKFKKMPISDLLDLSINDTLSRTLMTSVTTLIALSALFIFGGEVIRSFTFAMIWGVIIGTYSTVLVAAPILLFLKLRPVADSGDAEPAKA
jgi:preprotein translocase subunit SecF